MVDAPDGGVVGDKATPCHQPSDNHDMNPRTDEAAGSNHEATWRDMRGRVRQGTSTKSVPSVDLGGAPGFNNGQSAPALQAVPHPHAQHVAGDLKLFEPTTMGPLIAVRDREERRLGLVRPCGPRSM
jgi:hypothetical protein